MKPSTFVVVLTSLILVFSLSTFVHADANSITRSVQPVKPTFNQGETFTVTVDVSITEKFTYKLEVRDEVLYPAMGIIEASYTTGEVGGIYNIELERHLDHVKFTANIIPPVEVTLTYKVICSMPGTFHLPSASLSVLTTAWKTYSSDPYGPLTIISDAEQLLSILDPKITSVEDVVVSMNEEVGGEIDSIMRDLESLKGEIQSVRDNIIDEVGVMKSELPPLIQQTLLYSQVAGILAAIACVGAWVAVILARRKKT